jgi:hypothetical protein
MFADQRDFFHIESLALLVQQEVFHSRSTNFFGASRARRKRKQTRRLKARIRCCLRA